MTKEEVDLYLKEHGPVWELEAPPLDKCCICTHKIEGKPVIELRPTGLNAAEQQWAYCAPCALKHKGRPLSVEGFKNVMRHYEGAQRFAGDYVKISSSSGHITASSIHSSWMLPVRNLKFGGYS